MEVVTYRSSILHLKTRWCAALPVAFALLILTPAPLAAAQRHCAEWVDTLLDTSDNCTNEPYRERALEVEAFQWKGHQYVILNEGNEFAIHQVDDPLNPRKVTNSFFKFGNAGDSDYDLLLFDVCDDCRYGVLGHKVAGTAIFDLGVGAEPAFSFRAHETFPVDGLSVGGYVFSKGGQQYLIAADLPGDGCDGSGLYTLDGLGSHGLIECAEIGGAPFLVRGLQTLTTGDGILYLYIAAGNGPVHVLRADGAGAALDLVYQGSPAGMFGRRYELSIDADNRRAASADINGGVVTTWSLADPAHPVLEHTIPMIATMVSLRSPGANSASTLAMARISGTRSTRTFVVGDGAPEEFGAEYWSDELLPHNDLPGCGFESGLTLSEDGSVLFLSRNAIHKVFDLSGCLQPTPAIANLALTPGTVHPGESVTITDTSTGRIDRWAVWVEDETGVVVAGNDQPTAINPHEITFQVPQDVPFGTNYRAYIEVESDTLTPLGPTYDTPIDIHRAPLVKISMNPAAVVFGENVTLTATAEGIPAADPYSWRIVPPVSAGDILRTGASTVVALDETGEWEFYLTVGYEHGAETGGLYEASDEITGFDVSSVAADFTISPPTPLHNQQITLDGSISKPIGGNLGYAWQVESTAHSYTGCGTTAQCVIPGKSLKPDTTYNITLTVTNNDDFATSSTTRPLLIGNGDLQPAITYSPASPAIGQNVEFSIDGVPGDIDMAAWSLGGSGCDGADSDPVCVPDGLGNDCRTMSFRYATSGTKTVGLTVTIGANTFAGPPRVVDVASSGSCANPWACGNAGYDNGVTEGAEWFNGGMAGDPNYMYAVKFVLADFAYLPGEVRISALCADNQFEYIGAGGPWPNEVFIYPDSGGLPDETTILGQGTIWTGDGAGPYVVTLPSPVTLNGDFWIVSRGDPQWVNEDFNMEFDADINVGRSYNSETGITGLASATLGNYLLRATLISGPTIFVDGFDSGDSSAWSSSVGESNP